ncbi:hydrolase [Microbacterium soli]|uniref:Hydrolase n=1 Tax=Microbacterium soli TaxID=446075 RepID=A0ABP7NA04_9MICO
MTGIRREDGGIVTGRFTDHHVHLQLVDHTLPAGSLLGRVIDLGGDPAVLAALAGGTAGVRVEYAGAFLTAPGGYPSDRAWAPPGAVQEIADAEAAAAAVDGLAAAGASWIKVALHSEAGPVLDDDAVRAVVSAAAAHGLPVIAHAEGTGQAQRAARLGAARLAHAPFTERLTDDEIAVQAASVQWISTLAVHDPTQRAIAVDNVRRFADAGGTVLYGTDMGNGDTPVDLSARELDALREAGVDGDRLLRALTPLPHDDTRLLLPGGDPARARLLTGADLET